MGLLFVAGSNESVDLGTDVAVAQNVAGSTICAWVTMTSIPGILTPETYILYINNGGLLNTTARHLISYRQGSARFRTTARRIDSDGASTQDADAFGAPSINTIYHVASVANYSGQSLSIYVNGVLSDSLTIGGWTGNSSNTTSNTVQLATRGDLLASGHWNGTISDARQYDRALSAAEIQAIYSDRGSDLVSDYAHRWKLDEAPPGVTMAGAGVIKDMGNSKLNGTPANTPTGATSGFLTHRRRYG